MMIKSIHIEWPHAVPPKTEQDEKLDQSKPREESNKTEQGVKHDQSKPRFSLIPKNTLQPVIRVLEFGAQKYSENNWQQVPNADIRYFNAAHRHLDAWWSGEVIDSETNESHLAHAICCLMFLLSMEQQPNEQI